MKRPCAKKSATSAGRLLPKSRAEQAEVVAFLRMAGQQPLSLYGLFANTTSSPMPQAKPSCKWWKAALGHLGQPARARLFFGLCRPQCGRQKTWLEGERLILNKSQRRQSAPQCYYDLVGIPKAGCFGQCGGPMALHQKPLHRPGIYPACGIFPFCAKANMWLSTTLSAAAIKTKCCIFVLQAYPRDELFEIAAPALADTAGHGVLQRKAPHLLPHEQI